MAKIDRTLKKIAHAAGWHEAFVNRQASIDNRLQKDQLASEAPRGLPTNDDRSNEETREYPYIVVRVFAAVYQRESIQFTVGPESVNIIAGHCVVRHQAPVLANGAISPDCRRLVVEGVQAALCKLKHLRMCIVWAPRSCTYVETDRQSDSTDPPSGGNQDLRLQFAPQSYEPKNVRSI